MERTARDQSACQVDDVRIASRIPGGSTLFCNEDAPFGTASGPIFFLLAAGITTSACEPFQKKEIDYAEVLSFDNACG